MDKKIDTLRTNNSGEYTSNKFNLYYADYKIQRQLFYPYIPHYNGIVQRKNCILLDIF